MKNQKMKVTEILNFLNLVTPLVDMCYEILAEEYPCEFPENNEEYMEIIKENFITVPEWVEEETESEDTLFCFDVDEESGVITLEPADAHDFCYLHDSVLERLCDEDVDLSDLRDAVDYEVNYGE
ncbi:MAG: hypothetical protein R3Y24_16295 [Eubacteriales bacterium]